MVPRFAPIAILLPIFFCQCKSQRTVVDDAAQSSSLSGNSGILEKFAGWNAEEASWWAEPGETGSKKSKKKETKMRRTAFEKRVTDSRKQALFSKDESWAKREFNTKDFNQKKEKKTFRWPWENKSAAKKEAIITRESKSADKVSREGAKVAREVGSQNRDASKEFRTDAYNESDQSVRTDSNYAAEKAQARADPKIIRDIGAERAKAGEDHLTISDIRKLLNKK